MKQKRKTLEHLARRQANENMPRYGTVTIDRPDTNKQTTERIIMELKQHERTSSAKADLT